MGKYEKINPSQREGGGRKILCNYVLQLKEELGLLMCKKEEEFARKSILVPGFQSQGVESEPRCCGNTLGRRVAC